MVKLRRRFDFQGSFRRLERIANHAGALEMVEELCQRHQAKRARGEKITWDEELEFGLAAYDAGRMPPEAGLFWIDRFSLGLDATSGQRVQALWVKEFSDRFEAIRRKHGLAEDEDWPPGEAQAEYEALEAEFEEAEHRIHGEVLREYAAKTAHPLVREAADLYEADRLAFERCVEKGRQWFFGPPDEAMAKYLRSQGIID